MKRLLVKIIPSALILLLSFALQASDAGAQVKVNPDGVNVNSQGSTVVFLTFGALHNQFPGEGCWCGELQSAAPDLGLKCNLATVFGCLPARFDLSTRSGNNGFTDIMSIPPSVARRAYQSALDGADSRFFYVRRFISTAGGPDEFVPVTCRMTGGGARTPFALTDVKLSFAVDKPILIVKADETPPAIKAEIAYNGTGRLKGRWEVVLPGDEPPSEKDLLTEATLPIEERVEQHRYTQLGTFNVFLPPDGQKYELSGPDSSRLPKTVHGEYLVLLRIEATNDKEGDSNLVVAGAGPGVVHSGAVAGFPLPVLHYYVGGGPDTQPAGKLALILPDDRAVFERGQTVEFSWTDVQTARFYRLEVETLDGKPILSALLLPGTSHYQPPPWIREREAGAILRWRVVALDEKGAVAMETAWRSLKFGD